MMRGALAQRCRRSRLASRRSLSTSSPPKSVAHALAEAVRTKRLRDDETQRAAASALDAFGTASLRAPSGESAAAIYLHGPVGSGKSMLVDILHEFAPPPKRRVHFHDFMLDVHRRLHVQQQRRPRSVVLTKEGLPVFKFGDAPEPQPTVEGTPEESTAPPAAEEADPVVAVAAELSSVSLLCLDELQVTDAADAMVLRRLFEELISRGVRIAFTSNRGPEALYERGLNRRYFLPFVELLRERCVVIQLGPKDAIDYRLIASTTVAAMGETAAVLQPRAIGRLVEGPGSNDSLRQAWAHRHERGDLVRERAIPVGFGRRLHIKSCSGSSAYFSFCELCGERPGETRLGASDYIALAGHLSEIYLADLPILTRSRRNEARRFVMLIDALYEARSVTLHLAAPSALQQLVAPLLEATADAAEAIDGAEVAVDDAGPVAPKFQSAPVGGRFQRDGELASFFTAKDESFMLRRTISRLREMCREVPGQEGAESVAVAQLGADDGSCVRSNS